MLVVRAIREQDLDGLLALAELVGSGAQKDGME